MTLIHEINERDYFKLAALSKSQIANWSKYDPMAFWLRSAFNPAVPMDDFTDALVCGKLYHMMVLERKEIKANFAVNDELGLSRKNKKWKEAQAESAKLYITSEELERAKNMALALSRQDDVRRLFSGGVAEKPFMWQDEGWNIPCKMKLDYLRNTPEGLECIDYKTTAKEIPHFIDKGGFQHDVGMYARGIKAKYGQPLKKFHFVFQSTNEGEENLIRIKTVEGAWLEGCEMATEQTVKQILPRLRAWNEANSIVIAEVDPKKAKKAQKAKEDAMLKCWLPTIEAEPWELSPYIDKQIADDIHKGE